MGAEKGMEHRTFPGLVEVMQVNISSNKVISATTDKKTNGENLLTVALSACVHERSVASVVSNSL